jgi:hypothetical protein
MRFSIIILASVLILSCTRKHIVKVSEQKIDKPKLEFFLEELQIPVFVHDQCNLKSDPNTQVICVTLAEFDKQLHNYRIMLDLIKQYKIINIYYSDSNDPKEAKTI